MSTLLTIRNSIPSRGLRAGLCRLLRRTGNSWNTPAPPVIGIWKEATYSRERSTAQGETVRLSQRQQPDGELKKQGRDRKSLSNWSLDGFPSAKALLSKLRTIFKMANSPPRITARRGGRGIKKVSRSIRF